MESKRRSSVSDDVEGKWRLFQAGASHIQQILRSALRKRREIIINPNIILRYNISKESVVGQYRLVTRPEAEHMAPMMVTLHGKVALV